MAISLTILHLGGVFEAVTACLYKVVAGPDLSVCVWYMFTCWQDVECEAVFQLLHILRGTLQCRTLTLSAMPDLSPLLLPLCSLAECHSARLELFNTKPNAAEMASSVYPLLAILATYPSHLDRRAQVSPASCSEVW